MVTSGLSFSWIVSCEGVLTLTGIVVTAFLWRIRFLDSADFGAVVIIGLCVKALAEADHFVNEILFEFILIYT